MPVDKRKVTIKTLLVSVAIPLLVFGIQMFLNGQPIQGGVAVVLGVAAVGVFVAFQEYDLPYEPEIRELVKSADITTGDVKELTEDVSTQVDDRVTTSGSGGESGSS